LCARSRDTATKCRNSKVIRAKQMWTVNSEKKRA
jgi:hypothetical protein